MNGEQIWDRIESLCLEHDMSLYRLSQLTGITQSNLSNMKNKRSCLSLMNIERICNAFGITLAQFFAKGEFPDLTQEQILLLNKWLDLDKNKQDFILDMIERLKQV